MEKFSGNHDLKEYSRKRNVPLYAIARELGVSDTKFSRMLRDEFTDEQKKQIREIIDRLAD